MHKSHSFSLWGLFRVYEPQRSPGTKLMYRYYYRNEPLSTKISPFPAFL